MSELPQVDPEHPLVAVTFVLRIVTLLALTVIEPETLRPSITVPGVLTSIEPELVSVVPAGTPTLP